MESRPNKIYRGEKVLTTVGDVAVYQPDHPNAGYNGYVLEHVLVMSIHLGRPLDLLVEGVAHKDFDTRNNDISNLQLVSKEIMETYNYAMLTKKTRSKILRRASNELF